MNFIVFTFHDTEAARHQGLRTCDLDGPGSARYCCDRGKQSAPFSFSSCSSKHTFPSCMLFIIEINEDMQRPRGETSLARQLPVVKMWALTSACDFQHRQSSLKLKSQTQISAT